MKYMLIMNTPRNGYEQYLSWPQELLEANGAFLADFARKLRVSKELVGAEGLETPEKALRVRRGDDGELLTDGVFPESKEFLAGFWIVEVESPERALQIAAEASTAPGATVTSADGTPIQHLWIEVRRVAGGRQDLG